MKYFEFFKMLEKKDHIINKIPNLTDEQKKEIIAFFDKHPSYENELGTRWNKPNELTWDDFEKIIYKNRDTKSQMKKAVKQGIEGIEEGKDYLDLGTYNHSKWGECHIYIPLNWKGSRVLASDQVPPQLKTVYEGYTGARWCIAYQKEDKYWKDYSYHSFFAFVFGEGVFSKKIALQFSKDSMPPTGDKIEDYVIGQSFTLWDAQDVSISLRRDEDLRSTIVEVLKNTPIIETLFKEEFERINVRLEATKAWVEEHKNEDGLVDLDGDVQIIDGELWVAGSKEYIQINHENVDILAVYNREMIIPFGIVNGSFTIYDDTDSRVVSLKNGPKDVIENYYCMGVGLKSLEGGPKRVYGAFNCSSNLLTSLKGGPEYAGYYSCIGNKLVDLEGAPKKVEYGFTCSNNKIASLEGGPEYVGRAFICVGNSLKNLKGAPKYAQNIMVTDNQLESLEGCPSDIPGYFDCSKNRLTTLKGGPKKVGLEFNCKTNFLDNLEGAPEFVGGHFYCGYNHLTSLKDMPKVVEGKIYCTGNYFEGSEGLPKGMDPKKVVNEFSLKPIVSKETEYLD